MAVIDIDFEDGESMNAESEAAAADPVQDGAAGTSEEAEGGAEAGAEAPEGTEDAKDSEPKAPGDNAAQEAGPGEQASAEPKPDKKDAKIAELNDRYLRLFAEFDNFRKRSETEKDRMFADGERTVLLKVLPLIDNFERALGTVSEDQKDTAFVTGIEKVYRAFMDQIRELGVTPIEAVGHEFDAGLHNAVMHVEDEALPENTIAEEFQKGYMFRDRVLRYSMVKVAN